MADAIVSLAVQKLGEFLIDQVSLLQGAKGDVEWLKKEFEWMLVFLKDAEENRSGGNLVQKQISEIKTVASDTVAILERYSSQVEGQETPKRGIIDHLRACFKNPKKYANLYEIAKDIKSLRGTLEEISRRVRDYRVLNFGGGGPNNFGNGGEGTSADSDHLGDGGEGPSADSDRIRLIGQQLRRTTSSRSEDHEIVGLEDETRKLLAELVKEDHGRCIISIYGTGGLGKTTLARKLYNQTDSKFDCQAWVCVSQEYRIEDLLRIIIKSFNKSALSIKEMKALEKMNQEDLVRYLRQFLKESRYLVVLDDVWDKEAWKILRKALPDNDKGSRVIITTRKKDVATSGEARTFAHELRFLSPEESWDLFCQKAFPAEGQVSCKSAKEELGRLMVEKCAGLPLAIIVLGGLLFHKERVQEWEKVKENIWQRVRDNSIVEISQLLSLSYDDLSEQMKPCFLYLAMYPEDYEIEARKLMFYWIAEEFIPQGEGGTMEDVAEECFNELIDRCLIQVTSQSFCKSLIFCKVHDLLRDLAVWEAKKEKFLDIYDPRKSSPPLLGCSRHAVHSHIQSYLSLDHSNNLSLTSLIVFGTDRKWLETEHLEVIFKNFKLLKVLDLECVFLSELPNIIGEQSRLKFLWLRHTGISKLPSSIGKLNCLQFLQAGRSSKLPVEICKLTELRFVEVQLLRENFPVGSSTNLHTIRTVSSDQWPQSDATKLTNLRNLAIEGRLDSQALDSITNLERLEDLFLSSGQFPEHLSSCQHLLQLQLKGRIETLPPINAFPPRLEMLELCKSRLLRDPMPILERLPNLRALYLLEDSYNGTKMSCTAGGFCELEYLHFRGLKQLEELQVEEGSMPRILGFVMQACDKPVMLPEKLKSVRTEASLVIMPWEGKREWLIGK